jgi:hypothetical protein
MFEKCLKDAAGSFGKSRGRFPLHVLGGSIQKLAILDEEALLTTLAYVDMNVIAAGMAKTPEESAHTSVKARAEHCREIGMLPNLAQAQAPSSGLRPPSPPRGRRTVEIDGFVGREFGVEGGRRIALGGLTPCRSPGL